MIIKYRDYDIEATPAEVYELLMIKDAALKQHKEKEQSKQEKTQQEKTKDKQKKRTKEIDVGKIKALRDAGWSMAEIADEMRIALSTVSKKLKEVES